MKEFYQNRAQLAQEEAAKSKKKLISWGLMRLVAFIVWIVLLIFLFQMHIAWGIVGLVLGISAFLWSVPIFQRLEDTKKFFEKKSDFNLDEISYAQYDLSQFGGGESFADPLHPYANDLDLFGQYSLFQLVNRTKNTESNRWLAQWLKAPPPKNKILERQELIKELSKDLEFNQALLCQNLSNKDQNNKDQNNKDKWIESWFSFGSLQKKYVWLRPLCYILPLINILATAAYFMDIVTGSQLLMIWAPTFLLEAFFGKRINQEIFIFSKICSLLQSRFGQVRLLEDKKFTSPLGQTLLQKIGTSETTKASTVFKQAIRFRDQFEARYNILVFPILVLLCWEFHWLFKSQKWKEEYGQNLTNQFEVIDQMEVFCGLGIFAHNHPNFNFPTFTDTPIINATAIGNPLIDPAKCITNTVKLPTQSHIKLLTGSNMAGKSTFLRSIGCNLVFANLGAPVFAQKMELPLLNIITSMRTVDSILDSTSSFWAELKRLKQVLELVQSGRPTYFLLDEILKGTNSRDRHTGNRALITQLLNHQGAGIIATHDLELTDLEAKMDGKLENVCIEVEINDGEMVFDRKLKKGYSKSYNATLLMKQIGIQID